MKTNIPNWIKQVIKNNKARERYYIKKYGNLDRMHKKDYKEQERIDMREFIEELEVSEANMEKAYYPEGLE